MTAGALRINRSAWRESRIPTLLLGAALIAVGAVVAVRLPSGDPVSAAMFAGVSGVAIWMFSSTRYELTLAVVMLYLGLADGYLKLKTGSDLATLGRDLLLYAIVAGALVRWAIRGERVALPPLSGWVIAWVVVVVVQLANPGNGTLHHSLAALRPHLEFIPLFFLGYLVLQSKRRLRGFLLLLVIIAAVNGVVGLIQFNMTPEEFSSWGPGYAEKINGEGDVSGRGFVDEEGVLRTRPFALGSDMGFGGGVGVLAVPAALALLAIGGVAMRLAVGVLSIGVVLAVATSQARVAVIAAVLTAFAFAALCVTSRGALRVVVALLLASLVTYGSLSVLTASSEQGAFDRYSNISPDEATGTTYAYRSKTIAKIPDYIGEIPLGAGIGSKGPASGFGGRGTGGIGFNAESQPTFLLIEVGLPGLLVLLGLNLKLAGISLRWIRKLQDPQTRLLLAALAAPLLAMLATWVVGVSTVTSPGAPYMWLTAGALSYWLITRRNEGQTGPRPEPAVPALEASGPTPPTPLPAMPPPPEPPPAPLPAGPALEGVPLTRRQGLVPTAWRALLSRLR